MEQTTKALTLRATDYNENDKLLLLYSPDLGKITVTAKGIRKATAKLKFAAEPFCFAEYELVETHDRYVLKTATQIESFVSVRYDVQKFYCAAAVCEALSNEPDGEPSADTLVLALKTLSALDECVCDDLTVLIKFLLGYLDVCGCRLDFSTCNVCKNATDERKCYLDLELGGVVCVNCRTTNSLLVAPDCKTNLTLISQMDFPRLKNLAFTQSQLKECVRLLSAYYAHSIAKIKSLSEILIL